MNQILGILFLAGAAGWGYWRHRRGRDWIKPTIVCLFCTWWLATVLCPLFKEIRNPVYLVLAVWSSTWRQNERLLNRFLLFHPALVSFLALIAVSTVWAVNPRDAALRAVGLFLAFTFIWNLLRTADLTRIAGWVADGMLYSSYATIVLIAVGGGAAESIQGGGRWTMGGDLQATGTAEVCLWAFVRLSAEAMSQKGNRRVLHFILTAVALGSMIRTGTRGTLLQLGVVFPLLASIRLPFKNVASLAVRYLLVALVMLAAGVAIWGSLGEERRASYRESFRMDKQEGAVDTRSFLWKPALEKAKERPWLGRGLGSSSFFTLTDEEYKEFDSLRQTLRITVHNQYLEILYEFGLLGFVIFAWLLGAMLQNAIRIYSYSGPQATLWRMLAVYVVVGVLEGMTHGGQLTTGELNLLQRWTLCCCVLSFAYARALGTQGVAVPGFADRPRAGRKWQFWVQIPIRPPAEKVLRPTHAPRLVFRPTRHGKLFAR